MNDITSLVRRIEALPDPHRRHALERLSHALEPVEEQRKTVRGRPAQAEP